ncbi:cation diffusion facilitator family transporter [Lentisphaera profundi]|uniref:Cation diffusion facilitator family transporter n=1 Tax=Lentisphaera profundi TaxID=1658616 RepID=A0ABY7VU53_9BACT|nr:cation diffusion facilitator family transporter [Lentisphaera profundi]WDE96356.1 cation diffusion facilitator family transporter [Lentisphaera profundi]
MSAGGSLKSIFYALAANAGIAIAKFIAAFMTGSGTMFAEGIHSASDCGNQLLLLWGMKKAKQPPSPDYPLGYGKEIYFWSFLVAIIIFSIGGMYSLYEGIHKLQHPPESFQDAWVAVIVLIFGIILEGGSLLGCLKQIKHLRGETPLLQWCRETRKSELIVILGEDLAAELGMMIALVFILLAQFTGNPMYDAIGSLLIIIAIFIAIKVKGLLVGQSVNPKIRAELVAALNSKESVKEILNVITLQLGEDVMIAVKARMDDANAVEVCKDINQIEAEIKTAFPQVKWIFFEPDIKK